MKINGMDLDDKTLFDLIGDFGKYSSSEHMISTIEPFKALNNFESYFFGSFCGASIFIHKAGQKARITLDSDGKTYEQTVGMKTLVNLLDQMVKDKVEEEYKKYKEYETFTDPSLAREWRWYEGMTFNPVKWILSIFSGRQV